jgi:hypothetical protein
MTTIRMRLLFAAALGLAGPVAASAQTAPPAGDGPTIDETQGKPGTQSGAETQPGAATGNQPGSTTSGEPTGSTGAAQDGALPDQKPVDQDTQSEDTGLQKQEGQPGTQSGTPPLAQ